MLAALLYGQEDLRFKDVPSPAPAAGEVVIQVKTATTCGTDLKVWRRGGHARMLQPPTLFGHEGVGEIVAVGEGVKGWKIGDRDYAIGLRGLSIPIFTYKIIENWNFRLHVQSFSVSRI